MQTLSKNLDRHLSHLAWSLWTELGVAGVKRSHQQWLIDPEALILLTAAIAATDPRLRDEVLDWCVHNHQYISISRLRTLLRGFDQSMLEALSIFSATLNMLSHARWPLFTAESPLKILTSGKSKPPQFDLPGLLCFRLRALFGVGARADLIVFFLAHEGRNITASDATEIGYSKRNLAEVLESFVHAQLVESCAVRNQKCYRLVKYSQLTKILGVIPKNMPAWREILEVLLTLRVCIQQVENKSESTKVVEIRNTLKSLEPKLRKLNLQAPVMNADFSSYWDSFSEWILKIAEALSDGSYSLH